MRNYLELRSKCLREFAASEALERSRVAVFGLRDGEVSATQL